jgi:Protein of unknown function (DUF3618)
MTHHADPRLIEAEIERDRAELAATLDALQNRVSVDALAQEALGLLRTNSASYVTSIDAAVRANPVAVALVGAGLAWLIFGKRATVERPTAKTEALLAWEDDGGPARPSDERLPGWADRTDSLRQKASAALRKLDMTTNPDGFAREHAGVLATFTDGLRQGFRDGLDGLSQSAQDKIIAAREAAYAAGLRLERAARSSSRETGRMIEDHPMVMAAVMLALGAAFGASLPRSTVEDNAFGAERDRLMRQAADLLAQEKALAQRIAGDIADTAKAAMDTVADTIVETADAVSNKVMGTSGIG